MSTIVTPLGAIFLIYLIYNTSDPAEAQFDVDPHHAGCFAGTLCNRKAAEPLARSGCALVET